MSYSYDLILKQRYGNNYELTTLEGRKLFDIYATNKDMAYTNAVAIMSSWNSVRIRFEEEYEQDKERDRVSNETPADDVAARGHPTVPKK